MNQQKHTTDLQEGRAWLDRAARALTRGDEDPESVAYAHAAGVIGHGFVALAHATQALDSMAATARRRQLFDAAVEREERAADEARPHDEPAHSCSFERDGSRCINSPDHLYGHELADGRGYPAEADRG